MDLDNLPRLKKCLFCISIRDGIFIISKGGLLLFTPILLLLITGHHRIGIHNFGAINFSIWLKAIVVLWIATCILLIFGYARCIKNETTRDTILHLYFWAVVVIAALHLVFSITYLVFCWEDCFLTAIIHLVVIILLILISIYTLLIVNSFRMGLGDISRHNSK